MWIILLFLCVSLFLPNNAQESTNFQTQTATETSYTNSDVNVASTRSPVITLTIRNGRNENVDQRVAQSSDSHLYYSDDWKRMFMPADAERYVNENQRAVDHQFEPIFLRRPDVEENNTALPKFAESNPFLFQQVPIFHFQRNLTSDSLTGDKIYADSQPNGNIPISEGNYQLFDLYRIHQSFITPGVSDSPSSLNTNVENLKSDQEPKVTSLSAEPKASNSDLITSRTSGEIIRPLPAEDRLRGPIIPTPVDFYRDPRFWPQVVPAYFPPYPLLPFQRDSAFQPMMPYIPNGHLFDRERGSEVNERIQEGSEKEIISQDTTGQLAENEPSETSTSIVPQQPLPLPAQGYPIQPYPFESQPLYPIPNIPQSGFPFSPLPLPQPRNVARDIIATDLAQLPPVPAVVPEVLPDNLTPEEQATVITGSDLKPEETVPVEEPVPTKIPYAFGFDMNDGKGNDQFRKEVSDISGAVQGSYGFRDADGRYRTVTYFADHRGFRASILSNEPGIASSGSADVAIVAERPPPNVVAEGLKVAEPEIVVVPNAGADLIAPGSIPEPI